MGLLCQVTFLHSLNSFVMEGLLYYDVYISAAVVSSHFCYAVGFSQINQILTSGSVITHFFELEGRWLAVRILFIFNGVHNNQSAPTWNFG